MRIGPFAQSDLEPVIETLTKLEVEHSIYLDEAYVQTKREEANRGMNIYPSPSTAMDPSGHFIDIVEEHANRIGNHLEGYGIIITPFVPDLESEEYICPICPYRSNHPGHCEKHQTELVSFSEWNASRKEKREKKERVTAYLILLFMAAGLGFGLWSYLFY